MARRATTKRSRSKKGGRSSSGFKYRSRSKESYERSAAEQSGNFDSYLKDGTPRFQPHDGTNRIRILPPTFEDPEDFAITILVHYGIGADEQTYLCRKMLGDDEDCAICDEYSRLVKEGDAEDANDFKQRKRKGIWLLDRKSEEDGAKFWAMPFGTWKDVILVCKDEDGDVIELDHPQEGHDVLFTKEGAKQRTKYTGVRLGKSRPILTDGDEMERILEFIQENPLDGVLNFFENEHLQAVLEGKASKRRDDDDDEDEDDVEDEDEDEEDEDEDDDVEDEDEDEEDEDDDDDEEEDEDEEDEDDDEEEDEDEDEEDESDDDDDDEEDDDDVDEDEEEEEEEKPKRRRKSSSSSSKAKKTSGSRTKKTTSKKSTSAAAKLRSAAKRARGSTGKAKTTSRTRSKAKTTRTRKRTSRK